MFKQVIYLIYKLGRRDAALSYNKTSIYNQMFADALMSHSM